MSEEQTPFGVTEEINLGDLSGLKEIKDVLPTTSNVRVRIDKASVRDNSFDGSVATKKYLNLQLRLIEGISFVDENSEAQTKFQNKVVFTNNKDIPVWVDTNHEFYKAEKYTKGAYLIPLRQLWSAVGKDPKDVKINDEELKSLIGMEVLVDVVQNQKRAQVDGKWSVTGEFENLFKNWKKG